MERFIITLDESGTLHVPDVSSTFIWMDEPELVKESKKEKKARKKAEKELPHSEKKKG